MEKLEVRLPGIRKCMKTRGITAAEDIQPKKAKSSKERVKAYRERQKTNPKLKKRCEELKLKKKAENKACKANLKENRKQNSDSDNEFKQKQNRWWKKSKTKEAEKTE